nr:Coiled-coil domain-containing protein 12 [Polyrhizophydium stewartii]
MLRPLRFRNYQPEDAQLQEHVEEAAPIGPTAKDRIDTVEGQVEALKKETFEAERRRNKELDLNNLAPKKPNWDLKRDLDKRLEKLDRRTKRVIAELNWERFKSERDIAGAAEHDASTLGRGNDDDDDDE